MLDVSKPDTARDMPAMGHCAGSETSASESEAESVEVITDTDDDGEGASLALALDADDLNEDGIPLFGFEREARARGEFGMGRPMGISDDFGCAAGKQKERERSPFRAELQPPSPILAPFCSSTRSAKQKAASSCG